MSDPLPRFITALAESVVSVCDPDELLLFGSYAKGLHNRYSDVDLLAVLDRPATATLRGEIRDATACVPLPVDVHLHSYQELCQIAADPNGFHGSILTCAKSLYRAPGVLSILDLPPTRARTAAPAS